VETLSWWNPPLGTVDPLR